MKKPQHGGHRDGAGRKADLLKVGRKFLEQTITPDHMRVVRRNLTVTLYDRERGKIELRDDETGEVTHLSTARRKPKPKRK